MKEPLTANLLFVYGPSGSGKTRLLRRITELSDPQFTKVGAEEIVEDMYRWACGDPSDFPGRYARVESLLIDNLWILRTRPAATKAVGALLKERMTQGYLTVLASDLGYENVLRDMPALAACLEQKNTLRITMAK